ncbi:MAG TPA: hypothetical protein VKT80_11455 [Chloroflexota bacterium]|nr:hypothetical protein [Chloroflexota bacterium]
MMDRLDREKSRIPSDLAEDVSRVRQLRVAVLNEFRRFSEQRIEATRIRCHGDCNLHQVLSTGKDYVFIDFEGRPDLSVGERRLKRSPLRDVVSLVRSFDYAAEATLFGLESGRGRATGVIRDEDRPALSLWARAWRLWMHDAFLQGYLTTCAGASFLPSDAESRNALFRIFLLERLLSETAGELRKRPLWIRIPLAGLLEALSTAAS